MTRVSEATSKTNCPKIILPPPLETVKIWPPKEDKPMCGTKLYYHANFHAVRRDISVPGQKIHISHYRGLPWGPPYHVIHFWKAVVEKMLRPIWYVTLRLTVREIFAVKIWDYGAPWEYTQSGNFMSGTDIHHRAKCHADWFHRHRDICNRTDRCNCSRFNIKRTHTSVSFVDSNNLKHN